MTTKQKQKHKELKILSEQISKERNIRIQGVLKKKEETLLGRPFKCIFL